MPGMITHKAAMQKTINLLRTINFPLPISVGSYLDNIDIDRNFSHAFDIVKDKGNIIDYVEEYLLRLNDEILSGKDISKTCRYITHLVVDSLTIGQICGTELWGKFDDRIDIVCEMVSDKDKWNSTFYYWTSVEEGLHFLHNEMQTTYDMYYKDTKKWFSGLFKTPTPKDVTNMTRRAVSLGASISASFIYLTQKNIKNIQNIS